MRLELFDADKDGSVSRTEFTAGAAARFDTMDTNHDGIVTADERRATWGRRPSR
ncbi:hypothetical protein [Sphingomonas sp.]|uniref:hypothetical protein n=1 Tax=Sphingomonas sp. TaxID=28214 RepID=UPI003B3A3137